MSELVENAEGSRRVTPAATPAQPLAVFSLLTLVWVAAGSVFLLLRLGPIWRTSVGGAELVHLSGAWQAHLGVDDSRFIPTLFQSLAAALFGVTDSEVAVRVLAFIALLSIPVALWLLRPALGEVGSLFALLLLALDAPAIALGVSGSALAFDLPLAIWLFVFMVRGWPGNWALGVAGLLVALSGPLTLPLLAGWAAAALLGKWPVGREGGVWAAGGVATGVVFTTLRFGLGFHGLVFAPFDLFAAGFTQDWSTSTAFELLLLYSWPLVLGGLAAAGYTLYRLYRRETLDRATLMLLGWAAFSAAWFLAGAASHQSVPLVALTTPLALLLGPAIATAAEAMFRADWRYARYQLPFAALATLLGLAIVVDWGRTGVVGPGGEQTLATLWFTLAVVALALVAARQPARPTLLAAGLVAGAVVMFPGVLNVALSNRLEPMPSPISTRQARDLRDLALATQADQGGTIVIHPNFEKDITWPFRDSGKLVIASRVPSDATFVLWPPGAPDPEGLAPVEGQWALTRSIEPPTTGFLAYLGWFTDRDKVRITSEPVAVYSRTTP